MADVSPPTAGAPTRTSRTGLFVGLVLGGVALLVAIVVVISLVAFNTLRSASPEIVVPTAEPTTLPDPVLQFEPRELAVSDYPDADSLARAFFQEVSNWYNIGGVVPNGDTWYNTSSGDGPIFTARVFDETDQAYIHALVIEGYDADERLNSWVVTQVANHEAIVTLNWYTTPGSELLQDPDVQVAYVSTVEIDSIRPVMETSDQVEAIVIVKFADNSDLNNADELTGSPLDEAPQSAIYQWTNVGGVWKLSEIR